MSYSVSAFRRFRAMHWMPMGKEEERAPHEHDYRIEVRAEGRSLSRDGFLVDIDVLKGGLDDLVEGLSGKSVNELPELRGLPPSLENFAAAARTALLRRLNTEALESITVTLWESEDASASYTERLGR